ncbi:MFS general substrate transporter [Xylariaceae sp. FL0594]|nr:MFS general substrate transporter [Xylariaceae sp. FL0594]
MAHAISTTSPLAQSDSHPTGREGDAVASEEVAASKETGNSAMRKETVLPADPANITMPKDSGVNPEPRPAAEFVSPQEWPKSRKWCIILVLSMVSLMVAISLVINAPAANAISHEFDNHSGFLFTFFITVPNLGQVVAAFYIGPLSERFGRVPVCHFFNALWLVFTLAGGFSTSLAQVVVFRFLTGATISSINLNPAVSGDLFSVNQRGLALSVASFVPLAGSAIGPIVGGYITQYLNWRWTFWIVAIATGALFPLNVVVLRETYAPVLRRRALKKQGLPVPEQVELKRFENGPWESAKEVFLLVIRPFLILSSSHTASLVGVYLAILFGYLSVLNSTNATVFQEAYGFSEGSSGLVYLSTTAGTLVGSIYCGFTLDYFLVRGLPHLKKDENAAPRPENRLIPALPSLVLFPIGLLVYGWSIEKRVHFIVPILSTFLYGFSLSSSTVPIMSYLVDIFGDRSASAVGAVLPLRYLTGAFLPIATPYMYAKLGYGWSNTFLALILVILAPFVLRAVTRSSSQPERDILVELDRRL